MIRSIKVFRVFTLVLFMISTLCFFNCTYLKVNPPPDVDKNPFPPAAADNSCWIASASNMLAGAGYGNGSTMQQRADDIYADMVANYTTALRGWPDAALQWWIGSANNVWPNNPYTLVSYKGNKTMWPWSNTSVPEILGTDLRECDFVSPCFSWPTDATNFGIPVIGKGGHATTHWGDNFGRGDISGLNPTQIIMTDSDRDGGGNIQVYNYDNYNNPNPGGPDEGPGWYFDYGTPHPYIRGAAILSPVDIATDNIATQIVTGSFKIHQGLRVNATDLHYIVGTDVPILSYYTEIDWDDDLTPTITESQPVNDELQVDWDLTDNTVPYCNWVTITTEFILPRYNGIYYRDVRFTYPFIIGEVAFTELNWEIQTPTIANANNLQDVTGGYVVGEFDLISPDYNNGQSALTTYRFVHQYLFNQDPEIHKLYLNGDENLTVTNLRIGHTYELLEGKDFWRFDNWMTKYDMDFPLSDQRTEILIDWEDELPYPKGMDVRDVLDYIKEDGSKNKIKKFDKLFNKNRLKVTD